MAAPKKTKAQPLPMWVQVIEPIPDAELDKLDKCPKCGDFFWLWNGLGEMRCGVCHPPLGFTKHLLALKRRLLGAD